MAFYDITGTMIMALLLWLHGNGDPSRSVLC